MSQFLSFPLSLLQAGDTTHFDIFLTETLQIYALAGHTWTAENMVFLHNEPTPSHIYYLPRDSYEADLFRAKKKILSLTGGDLDKTSALIAKVLEDIQATGAFSVQAKGTIEASTDIIIDRLIDDPRDVALMGELRAHDDYTHQHNVRVGVYSAGLAIQMGVTSRTVLRSVSLGGTLHDLGKIKVPLDILNKPGKLTLEEFAVVQTHPAMGAELVKAHYGGHQVVMDIVEKHHEKVNGSGYPSKLSALEIPQYVRIATVADIFDALTTARSYHSAKSPYEALALMRDKMSGELDHEAFKAMVLLQARQPKAA